MERRWQELAWTDSKNESGKSQYVICLVPGSCCQAEWYLLNTNMIGAKTGSKGIQGMHGSFPLLSVVYLS